VPFIAATPLKRCACVSAIGAGFWISDRYGPDGLATREHQVCLRIHRDVNSDRLWRRGVRAA